MTRDEVIARLCALVSEVGDKVFHDQHQHDCFCGHNDIEFGRVESEVVDWLEHAVKTAIEFNTSQPRMGA